MTLAEKITALRGERKLSQGDLAERLDVSRQSVSKWETGQAVPELDKIIRLADLFGVTVDELVRDEKAPSPEPPRAEPLPAQLPEAGPAPIYITQRRYTPAQILGIISTAGGLMMMLFALASETFLFLGGSLVILGLPLLLAKKHPLLIDGWIVWAVGYLTLCTPPLMAVWRSPLFGFWFLWQILNVPNSIGYPANWGALLLCLAYLIVAVLTVLLPILTVRLAVKKRREKKQSAPQADG